MKNGKHDGSTRHSIPVKLMLLCSACGLPMYGKDGIVFCEQWGMKCPLAGAAFLIPSVFLEGAPTTETNLRTVYERYNELLRTNPILRFEEGKLNNDSQVRPEEVTKGS